VLFAVALAAYILITLADTPRTWSMLDLQIYWQAGIAARHGLDVYRLHFIGLPFTYTPFALLLFETGARLSINALRWTVTVASVAGLLATVWIAWGMAAVPGGLRRLGLTLGTSAVALWLEPVVHNLGFGQINVFVMFLVVVDLCQPDRRPWKGFAIGLAAAIKLTPGIFIAYLLVTRRYRATAVSAATFCLTVAIGFLVLPLDSRRFWIGRLFMDSRRVGGVGFVGNQSINGVLVRLFHGVSAATPWWWLSAIVTGCVGLGLAAWASHRGEELLAMMICALTGLLVSPISWSHHWVWVAPGLVLFAHLAYTRRSRLGLALLAGVILIFSAGLELIWRVPHAHTLEYTWHGWQPLVGDAYVILGLGLLVAAALYLRQTGRPPPSLGPSEELLRAGASS
jgi:alpha-1,2-mannosyltransferase